MVAQSRTQLTSSEDMAFGNVELERRLRGKERGGYESVMWYVEPGVTSVEIIVQIDGFTSTSPSLPGFVTICSFIWGLIPL